MTPPITELYSKHPELYEAIANDRAFDKEVEAMADYVHHISGQRPAHALELCAGPAYHALQLHSRGIVTTCIDCCDGMRDVACRSGAFPRERYLVSTLPQIPSVLGSPDPVDTVILMRFSIGYFDPDSFKRLIRALRPVLSAQALLFIEIHDLSSLVNGFRELDIRRRTVRLDEGSYLVCDWPSGPLTCASNELMVEMPVTISVHGTAAKTYEFVSREYVFTAAELDRLSREENATLIDLSGLSAAFPHSHIAVIKVSP